MDKSGIKIWGKATVNETDFYSDFLDECGSLPAILIDKLAALSGIDIDDHHNHKKITSVLKRFFPPLAIFAKSIKIRLQSGVRFVVIKNIGFIDLPLTVRDIFIVGFCSLMGKSTPTDQIRKQIIWPVTVDAKSKDKFLTFSQHNHEAGFHTDTQYFPFPEDVATLWCISPDKYGEGVNALVDGRFIVRELAALPSGADVLQTLFTNQYPFRVPTIFTKTRDDNRPECTEATILGVKPFIRYRADTIKEGFHVLKIHPQPKEKYALDMVEKIAMDPKSQVRLLLQKDEVLLTNNHEILHSRDSFRDTKRLLLRVRFNF